MTNNTDKKIFDIAIIGGGIVGTGIAYELSKFNVSLALIEKASQVTQGASKGNSGIIHAGYDDSSDSLKGKLVAKGNKRYDDWVEELGVGMKRPGSLVVAFDEEELEYLKILKEKGDQREIPVEIIDKKELLEREPNLNKNAIAGLFAPTAGIVCPMRFVNYLQKNSVINGMTPFLNTKVIGFEKSNDEITVIKTNKKDIHAKIIINAAGLWGDEVSSFAQIEDKEKDTNYEIIPRKGEYILLEPHTDYNVNHILFPTPTKMGKGILVVPTETGDILLGPTSHNMSKLAKGDVTTSILGLQEVIEKTKKLVPNANVSLTVKTYAGNRAQANTDDFIIERYTSPKNFINVIGIKSPGLTAAPAIADMVIGLVEEIRGKLEKKSEHKKIKFSSKHQEKEAMEDVEWANTIAPNLDAPSVPLLNSAWDFGVKNNLYNYACFSDRGLGVDLGSSFQNELIQFLVGKGLSYEEVLHRLENSQQVIEKE